MPAMPVGCRTLAQRAAALTSIAVLALAGCGDDVAPSPAQDVRAATSAVLDTESLTVSVGLDLDDASRTALLDRAEEQQDGQPAGSQLSPGAVEHLLDARVVTVLATTDGADLSELDGARVAGEQPGNPSSSISLVVDGESLVELRQVAGVLYAHIDAAGLDTALGTPGLADSLTSATAGAPPALADAAAALASGGWVSLDSADLATQLQSMGGAAAPGASPDEAAAGAVQRFLADAKAVVSREVVVTEDGDDAYQVTAPLDRIVDGVAPSLSALVRELSGLAGGMAGGTANSGEPDSGIADAQEALAGRSVTVDLQMDGDRLSTVTMDVSQLLDEADRAEMTADGVTGLPVVAELTEDGEVEVPDDAVALDLAAVMAQAGGTAPAP